MKKQEADDHHSAVTVMLLLSALLSWAVAAVGCSLIVAMRVRSVLFLDQLAGQQCGGLAGTVWLY